MKRIITNFYTTEENYNSINTIVKSHILDNIVNGEEERVSYSYSYNSYYCGRLRDLCRLCIKEYRSHKDFKLYTEFIKEIEEIEKDFDSLNLIDERYSMFA